MKLKHWIALSIVLILSVGCAQTKEIVPESQPVATVQPKSVKSGTFTSGEQPTTGSVRLVSEQGKWFLELDESFKTSEMGPDLVVILHRSEKVLDTTKPPAYPLQTNDYAIIAPLQEYSGAQRYVIPDNVNPTDYQSAAIWCRKFNATFGAAALK